MPFEYIDEPKKSSKFEYLDELPKKEAGFIDSMSALAGQFKNPGIDVLTKGYADTQTLANKLGEVTAEEMGKEGYDPRISAGLGAIISISPDILTSLSPSSPIGKANKMAINLGNRAAGFTKRFQANPLARGQAAKAVETALEKDILSTDFQKMFDKSVNLANESGRELGDLRKSVGPQKIGKAFDSLEDLREKLTKGRVGGEWDTINKRIDNARDTLFGIIYREGEASLDELVEAKKRIKGAVSYLTDNISQEDTKKIVSNIEESIENIFKNAGGNIKKYKELKRTYGSAKKLQEGLNNLISSQQGNNSIPLTSYLAAGSQMAAGNPLMAAGSLGFWKSLTNASKVIGAKEAYGIPKSVARANALIGPSMGFENRRKSKKK